MEDFLCAVEGGLKSNPGEVRFLYVDVGGGILLEEGGDDGVVELDIGNCIDWDEDRRKNGMEEGVSRFDCPRRTDDVGLRGPGCGGANAKV